MSKGTLTLFGCGGAGANLVSRFENCEAVASQAIIKPYYFDTSTANLKDNIDPARYYVLKDKDGSGGVRAENHEAISKVIRNVLQEQEPGDFNIVVFSASGGSGSVSGPLIVKELLERDLPVIAVVIGACESNLATENTMKTLKSLDSIATNVVKRPVVIYYAQNNPSLKRSETDHAIYRAIMAMSILVSHENEAMDSQDVLHWVQYHRSTKVKPGLALLDIYDNNEHVERHKTPIAILSLYKTPDDAVINVVPEYSKAGYPRVTPTNFNAMHYVIDHGELQDIAKDMNDLITDLDKLRSSRVQPVSLISNTDHATETGLIL